MMMTPPHGPADASSDRSPNDPSVTAWEPFRHQACGVSGPPGAYRLIPPPRPCRPDSAEFARRMAAVGDRLQAAGVGTVVLMHGTFVGDDPTGLIAGFDKSAPRLAARLRRGTKRLLDRALRNVSNFDPVYRDRLSAGLNAGPEQSAPAVAARRRIAVERFIWSGENNHIGRADAAVRLLDWLSRRCLREDSRVLVVGHSHAGNALALATQLCGISRRAATAEGTERAGLRDSIRRFFAAAESYFQTADRQPIRDDVWQRVRDRLLVDPVRPGSPPLDVATLGTPVRYGWDRQGCGHLLHLVNHRPDRRLPEYRSAPNDGLRSIFQGRAGDFVQRLGIVGTNFSPCPWSRAFRAERQLARFLAPGLRWWGTWGRIRRAPRVHAEGLTLLVRYGDETRHYAAHVLGHGVYTQFRWMPLQFEQIAGYCYGHGS